MVSTFERAISLGGLFSLYTYTMYKFVKVKTSFNKKFHDAMLIQGEKFEKELNCPHFKMLQTPNEKILFLFGLENSASILANTNMSTVQKIIENFTPNAILLERDLK